MFENPCMISNALTAIKKLKGIPERCYLQDENKIRVHFDSVESESWSSSTSVTNYAVYAVEKGQNISDHIKVNPDSITLSASITNHTSISRADIESNSLDISDNISERLKKILEWQNNGALLTYYGAIWEGVRNCVITSIGQSRNTGSGEAVELSLSLQKVIIAEYREAEMDRPQSVKETSRKGLAKTDTQTVDADKIQQVI